MSIFLLPKARVGRFARLYFERFPHAISVDGARTIDVRGRRTPVLKHGAADLTLDHAIPDKFFADTGCPSTVFVRCGDDLVRASTSIKIQNGERAVGTPMDRAHPSHPRLLAGESYVGLASTFGQQLMAQYDPIKDASGKVIGAFCVAFPVSDAKFNLSAKLSLAALLMAAVVFGGYAWGSGKAIGALIEQQRVAGAAGISLDKLAAEVDSVQTWYAAMALMALLLVSGVLYWLMHRAVTVPLLAAKTATEKLAAGDLTAQLHVERSDELGQLMHAINGMSQGLARIVGEVRQGSDQITLASREIATGNSDLSSRTESQASALEETASSMEALTRIVKQNADNALEVNGHVSSAAAVAEQGGNAVGRVVETMESIKQSSLRIADILSVIDGIAFQTNILALNAAVEAARAGDHGRGFAVVAAEVRNLAQRSASAAKEIKTLIDDSVGNVEAGGKLVAEAGHTMAEIITSVKRVTTVVMEITEASQEQSTGIAEVNNAITHMDEMTQENAALVEEAAAAAQSMYDNAVKLSDAVGFFKLAGSDAKAAPAPAAGAKRSIQLVASSRPRAHLPNPGRTRVSKQA
jgi:methyl-accepting chemotaxis protein-2 (aspartate sensor receptor)